MVKGTFGLMGSKRITSSDRNLDKQIRAQINRLEMRKRQLMKSGQFTPERREFVNTELSELKRALRR